MNADSIELEPTEAIALLQPFVDDELGDEEREAVARQIAESPEYQAYVREQEQVRAVLQKLAPELAPAGLRERVLMDLDAIEAERSTGWLAPIVGRIKSFGRGALLMVPAAAAAGVLFMVASNSGWMASSSEDGASVVAIEGGHVDGGMAKSLARPKLRVMKGGSERGVVEPQAAPEGDASLPSAEALADQLGFAVQVAPPRSLPKDVALVSDSDSSPASSAIVRYSVGDGAVVVDRQRRAGPVLDGPHQVFRGHPYRLTRDQQGRPSVEFQLGGVHHALVLEGAPARADQAVSVDEPDFGVLLLVADALRQTHG